MKKCGSPPPKSVQYERERDLEHRAVSVPSAARYFITCLPLSIKTSGNKHVIVLPEGDGYWEWIALYNSHLFHAHWIATGNAQTVSKTVYESVKPPVNWGSDEVRRKIGRIARELVSPSTLATARNSRQSALNYNFHKPGTRAQALISQLDRLLLIAYGFPEDPLLNQMRLIREYGAHAL